MEARIRTMSNHELLMLSKHPITPPCLVPEGKEDRVRLNMVDEETSDKIGKQYEEAV